MAHEHQERDFWRVLLRGVWIIVVSTYLLSAQWCWPADSVDGASLFSDVVAPLLARRCISCHGPTRQESNLRLDDRASLLEGGKSGPAVIPGRASSSLLFQMVEGAGPVTMPPDGERLTQEEVESLRRWIEAGVPWTAASGEFLKTAHWAFRPLLSPHLPSVSATGWCRSPADRYVLSKMEARDVAPSAEADRATLFRRLSLDLRGLPPRGDELEEFHAEVAEEDQAEIQRDVLDRWADRFLASPAFGVHWSFPWLDLARYGDTDGKYLDADRPSAWRFRDWVVNSINHDQPYDEFTVHQLAGDLLPKANASTRIAAGFHRHTVHDKDSCVDQREELYERHLDRARVTAMAWTGITLGCAQCHDHKLEPFTQSDFYRLMAFFVLTDEDDVSLDDPAEQERLRDNLKSLDDEIAERIKQARLIAAQPSSESSQASTPRSTIRESANQESTSLGRYFARLAWGLSASLLTLLAIVSRRISIRWRALMGGASIVCLAMLFTTAESPVTPDYSPPPTIRRRAANQPPTEAELERIAHERLRGDAKFQQLQRQRQEIAKRLKELPTVLSFRAPRETRQARLHIHGEFLEPGPSIEPGVWDWLLPFTPRGDQADRLDLARWLVDPRHPLTPRFASLQIGQLLFAAPLVPTPDNLGVSGEAPEQRALIDWMARELIDSGWSRKHVVRRIIGSAVYRQASRRRADLDALDPDNRLLARQNRRRLAAETLRDYQLAACDSLNASLGGAPFRPPLSELQIQVGNRLAETYTADQGGPLFRRTLYMYRKRTFPESFLVALDAPDRSDACASRNASNTPIQALELLNSPILYESARYKATQLCAAPSGDRRFLARQLFRDVLGRTPSDDEWRIIDETFANTLASKHNLTGREAELAAWTEVTRILLNLDEAVTRE
ncbi:MAG: PSD1 and planctomycete cytochrome C domain-containing protein [Pirellulales bacterium]